MWKMEWLLWSRYVFQRAGANQPALLKGITDPSQVGAVSDSTLLQGDVWGVYGTLSPPSGEWISGGSDISPCVRWRTSSAPPDSFFARICNMLLVQRQRDSLIFMGPCPHANEGSPSDDSSGALSAQALLYYRRGRTSICGPFCNSKVPRGTQSRCKCPLQPRGTSAIKPLVSKLLSCYKCNRMPSTCSRQFVAYKPNLYG